MRAVIIAVAALVVSLLAAPPPSPAQGEPPPPGRIVLSLAGLPTTVGDVRSDGTSVQPMMLVEEDSTVLWPRLSPDGSLLVYQQHDADGDWELYVMDSLGGDPVQVTDNTFSDGFPSWGPDGMLVSASDPDDDNSPEIMLTDTTTGDRVRLTTNDAVDTHPTISPDGTRVAFDSGQSGSRDVWVMNVDGTGATNLTPGPGTELYPAWSPDGQRIAFAASGDDGTFDVWVMNADGTEPRNLTQAPGGDDGAPTWSPDGTWIAFSTDRFEGEDRDIVAGPAADLTEDNLVPMAITGADEFSPGWGPLAPVELVRLAGPDRVATAVAIAGHAWADGARAAVLARSDAFPDALAGGALAVQAGGPLLLTGRDGLHPATADALAALLPVMEGTIAPPVYLLGGTAALSDQVAADVAALGYDVTRVAGPSRFHTAAEIARLGFTPGPTFLADGGNFRPALLAGATAASEAGALLLTSGADLPEVTADVLAERSTTRTVAVGPAAVAATPDAEPITAGDPYALAVATAMWSHGRQPHNVALASGINFPDGLTGGAHARWFDAPLLLTDPDVLPADAAAYLGDMTRVRRLFVYGGAAAIGDTAVAAAIVAIQGR